MEIPCFAYAYLHRCGWTIILQVCTAAGRGVGRYDSKGGGGTRLAAHGRRAARLRTCAKLMDRLLDESMQSGSQIALPRLEASSLGSLIPLRAARRHKRAQTGGAARVRGELCRRGRRTAAIETAFRTIKTYVAPTHNKN